MSESPENKVATAQLNIELSEDVAEGIYSNLVMIAHSPEEFILDFIRVMPGVPKARVKTRIIVTPQHARRLLGALAENIERYEGLIKTYVKPFAPDRHDALGSSDYLFTRFVDGEIVPIK